MTQGSSPTSSPAPKTANPTPEEKEEIYFEGSPSVYSSAGHLLRYGLLALILIAGAITTSVYGYHQALFAIPVGILVLFIPRWLSRSVRYRISSYRIDYERGLLSKDINTLELWHVEDVSFHQSLFDRVRNLGDITVLSHDDTTPQLVLRGIPNPRPLFESLKQRIITVKRQRGVIKMDTGN